MNRLTRFLLNSAKRYGLVASLIGVIGLICVLAEHAQGHVPFRFHLVAASDIIKACQPDASGVVTVISRADSHIETFDLRAERLSPHTRFSVFLTNSAVPPFGATELIGDFLTNAEGKGSLRANTIIEDAFATGVANGTRNRIELNHVVLWFSDPSADDFCFLPGTGPVTPFDRDGLAGSAALSSKNFTQTPPIP